MTDEPATQERDTISLKELLEDERITFPREQEFQPPRGYYKQRFLEDRSNILEDGDQYEVAPTDVSFELEGNCLWPSKPLDKVVFNGQYSISRDRLEIFMGEKRRGYHLMTAPKYLGSRDRITTIIEFKARE